LTENKGREELFGYLDTVLRKSEEKFKKNHSAQDLQLKWGRLLVQAIVAYGKLLETVQLDNMMKDIELIKEKIGLKE